MTKPPRTLVLGDPVVTLGDPAVIPDGALIVEGSRVVEVGTRVELEGRGPFDRTVGGPGHLVMPGFVNAHYHSECWTGPGLIGTIFELANLYLGAGPSSVDEEVLELLVTYGLIQAVKGGQTATVDAYYGKPGMDLFAAEPVLRAYDAVGMRTALALSLRDQNIYAHEADPAFLSRVSAAIAAEVRASPLGYAWPVADVLAAYDTLVRRWDGHDDRIRVILAPDWTPACSDELFRLCRAKADEYGTGITTHVLETRSELMWNVEVYGKPAMRRLADLGVLGPDVTVSHFVWATDEDIAILIDTGTNVSSNAGSNLRLSSGICRVRDILAGGGRICFGTDGISVSDREDFFAELRLAAYLQRQPDVWAEHRLDSLEILKAAGANGARALRAEDRVGRLAPGMDADLLCVRTGRLLFPPGRYAGTPILDVVLDRADAGDIDVVMVRGRTIVEGGRVLTVDEHRVEDRIRELAETMYQPTDESARWLALANELVPHAQSIYERWYSAPVTEPAAVYNARSAPTVP
jgi:5-methylthioadenosine/S-adenosylhomocysteine deaminase